MIQEELLCIKIAYYLTKGIGKEAGIKDFI